MWDFHDFQKSVAAAQSKLSEDAPDVNIKTEVGDFMVDFPQDGHSNQMEGNFVSLSEMAAMEADGGTPLSVRKSSQKANISRQPVPTKLHSNKTSADEIMNFMPAIKMEKDFELIDVHDEEHNEAPECEQPTTSAGREHFENPYAHEDSSVVLLDSEDENEYFALSMSQFNSDYEDDDLYYNNETGQALHESEHSATGIDGRKDKKTRQERNEQLDVLLAKFMPIIQCPVCPETSTNWPDLQEHFRVQHPMEQCYIPCCGRKLKEHWTLKEHMRFHNDPNTFKCKLCGKINTTRCALKRHIDAQHPKYAKLKHVCNICDKGFTTESGLKYHITSMHSDCGQPKRKVLPDGNSVFVCPDCGKAFPKKATARQHIWYSHRLVDQFKCHICGNDFQNPRQFREHVAAHTKKHLYVCAYCSMRFTYLNSLQSHKKLKHPNRPDEDCYIELNDDDEIL